MNHRFHHTFAIIASALIGFHATPSAAAVGPEQSGQGMELGAPFADHVVLQRETPVPV